MQSLEQLRIVLVETSHPGNIGAAARAMKTMGLSDLALVSPKDYPCAEATARASGADDILSRAQVHSSLADAVSDCVLVLGLSARSRSIGWPVQSAREGAVEAVSQSQNGKVALVFGRERTGLSNEELDLCRYLVHIPANPDYSSLNLAAAVQVLCYELRVAAGAGVPESQPDSPPADSKQLEDMYAHLEKVMTDTGFLNPENPRYLMRRLRRLFARAGLEENEVAILRGLLSSVERASLHKSTQPIKE